MSDLYREEILEHYRQPQNFGRIQNPTISSRQTNPLCGDDVEIFVQLKNNVVQNIGFEGKGCAISIASASILTEFAKSKSKTALTKFSEKDMLDLLKIKVSETRKRCALLALAVLKDCLQCYSEGKYVKSKS